MSSLEAVISSGDTQQILLGLSKELRNAYTTGRSTRGNIRTVINIISSTESVPPSFKLIAYEILWTVMSSLDAQGYRGLLSLARGDMLSADAPDLTVAALSTLRGMPAQLSVELLQGEDTDRSMVDAILGNAPSHVRAASVSTFARIACSAAQHAAGCGRVGLGRPFSSHSRAQRIQQLIFERACEVIRAVCSAMEDPDVDVSAAACTAGVAVLEGGSHGSADAAVKDRGFLRPTLLAAAMSATNSACDPCGDSLVGLSLDLGMQGAERLSFERDSLVSRVMTLRLSREVVRRVAPRAAILGFKLKSFRPAGRRAALRLLTLVHAHLLTEMGGVVGGLSGPGVARCESSGESSVVSGAVAFFKNVLIPAALKPAGGGGAGGTGSWWGQESDSSGDHAGVSGVCEGGPGPLLGELNGTQWRVQFTAIQCCVQLLGTFSAHGEGHVGRISAGQKACDDLEAVSGCSNLKRGGITAAAAGIGSLSFSTSNTYMLSSLSDGVGGEGRGTFATTAGPLWPLLSGSPSSIHASSVGSEFASLEKHFAPLLLSGVSSLSRIVAAGLLGSPGVVVATGGFFGEGCTGPGVSAQPSTGNGGLGRGGGSPLQPPPFTRALVYTLVRICELLPPSSLLSALPAVIRETGRIPDDIVEDPGAGSNQSSNRVLLLTRLAAFGVHAVLHECPPTNSLGYHSSNPNSSMKRPSPPSPSFPTIISRIIYSATRPISPFFSSTVPNRPLSNAGGSTRGLSSSSASSISSSSTSSIPSPPSYASIPYPYLPSGPPSSPHAVEISFVCTRFRAEVAAVFLQSLVRAAPSLSILTPLACASALDSNSLHTSSLNLPSHRLAAAGNLHVWLSITLDTIWYCTWVLEHRLTHCGVGLMSRDSAASVLGGIMGSPDALAPAPCPVNLSPPSVVSISGWRVDWGASDVTPFPVSGTLDANGQPAGLGDAPGYLEGIFYGDSGPNFHGGGGGDFETDEYSVGGGSTSHSTSNNPVGGISATGSSTAGPSSGGGGNCTGWAWFREYEATVEASETLMNALITASSCLYPSPTRKTYVPGTMEGAGSSLPSALALDFLPPRLLVSHRSALQRIFHALSRCELGIFRMHELERCAAALAPRLALTHAGRAGGGGLVSMSASRGTSVDILPSAIPLQLRILWLLCGVWDGSDGGALSAGVGAAGTAATASLPSVSLSDPVQSPKDGCLHSFITGVSRAERVGVGALLLGDDAAEEALYKNTTLVIEAKRQKRLSQLVSLLASEAGYSLGVGPFIESEARKSVAATMAIERGQCGSLEEAQKKFGGDSPQQLHAAPIQVSRPNPPASFDQTSGFLHSLNLDSASASLSELWKRGTKVGKTLGEIASKVVSATGIARGFGSEHIHGHLSGTKAEDLSSFYTGEGTIVNCAHFWLLLDMLAHLAASQRCTALLVKRVCECIAVLPRLSPDVAVALSSLIPRASLWSAAYGRSQLAAEFSASVYRDEEDEEKEGMALDKAESSGGARESKGMSASDGVLQGGVVGEDGTSLEDIDVVGLGTASRELFTARDAHSIFSACANLAEIAKKSPWSFSIYRPGRGICVDNFLGDPAGEEACEAARLFLERAMASASATAPPATLELLADVFTPPSSALIAAASVPDLTHNVSLGINRSSPSGTRMRTIPAIANSFPLDSTVTAASYLALHLSPFAPLAGDLLGIGARLPCPYIGSVPREVVEGAPGIVLLEDAQMPPHIRPDNSSPSVNLLRSFLGSHALTDPVLSASLFASADSSKGGSLGTRGLIGPSGGENLWGLSSGFSVGTPVTHANDPFLVTLSHTLHTSICRATLHISLTNSTQLSFPSGTLTLSVSLAGILSFDRSEVTTAYISPSATTLFGVNSSASGETGGSGDSLDHQSVRGDAPSMGAGSIGSALAADFLVMQRTSLHHATFTLPFLLAPSASISWDVPCSFAGFGSGAVKISITGETLIDVEAGGLIKAGRTIGCGAPEEQKRDTDIVSSVPSDPSVGGGSLGAWGGALSPIPNLAPLAGGLLWSGPVFTAESCNPPTTRGKPKPLSLQSNPSLSILVSSPWEKSAPHSSTGDQGSAQGSGGSFNSSAKNLTAPKIGGGWWGWGSSSIPSSASNNVSPANVGAKSLGDATAPSALVENADGVDDGEASSIGGSGGGDEGVTGADSSTFFEEGGAGDASILRPFTFKRLELNTATYRIPVLSLLSPAPAPFPPALSLAIATGCDVLPGAALGFGFVGSLSPLAASRVEGGGMVMDSPSAVNANGSVGSLSSTAFAAVASRVPYAHYALATTQVFLAPPPARFSDSGACLEAFKCTEGLYPKISSEIPMASPAWLPSLVASRGSESWARIPLPLAPFLKNNNPFFAPLQSKKSATIGSPPSSSSQHPFLSLCGDGVSQAAFMARTPAGAKVLLFFTGVLLPLPYEGNEFKTKELVPCVWQVSLQLRSDDARVRASLASQIHEVVHGLFSGRLTVLVHGHSPSSHSILQKLDVVTTAQQNYKNATHDPARAAMDSTTPQSTLPSGPGGALDRTPALAALFAPPPFESLEGLVKADLWNE